MGCQIFVCGTLSPDSESCIADLIFQLQDSFDGIHSINHVARSVRKRNQSHLLARDDDAVNNDRHGNRIKTNFVTGTETICTRNSLSFYPHSRTVTPRYLPPSITDSVTPGTFCTRNSLSFYPHTRTVTPRYLPPSITDSVTSQKGRSSGALVILLLL